MKNGLKIGLSIAGGFLLGLLAGFIIWGSNNGSADGDSALKRLFGSSSDSQLITANGGLYEIFVICPDDNWEGALGDTLRSILLKPVEMMNQKESSFDLLHINPRAFSKIVARHRNLLQIRSGSEYKKTSMTAQYDVHAAPQIVISLTGPNYDSIVKYVSDNRKALFAVFEISERNRFLEAAKRHNEKHLMELVEKKFGMKIDIPQGYKLRAQGENFIWISHERPAISQGFFIYDYSYQGKEDFDSTHLIARRNEFAVRIPGPSKGSFMTTYTAEPELSPEVRYFNIEGRHWAKMNGFWDVDGDFMGGPFVSYTTLNQLTQRIVTLDCYLYSPKHPKRNYMKQLENLVFSAKFGE